jgi:hypothetical protein
MSTDPSTGGGFRADPPSLRSDAAHWSAAAQTLSTAATAADQLALEARTFSHLACWTTGIDQIYASLQTKLAALLHQGVGSFTDIADALNTTATTYEHAEATAITKIAGVGASLGAQGGSRHG